MPSLNRSSILQARVLLFQLFQTFNICPSRMVLQFIRGAFQQKVQRFFVLAACETSYARGLKQMQLAADYSLHNR